MTGAYVALYVRSYTRATVLSARPYRTFSMYLTLFSETRYASLREQVGSNTQEWEAAARLQVMVGKHLDTAYHFVSDAQAEQANQELHAGNKQPAYA